MRCPPAYPANPPSRKPRDHFRVHPSPSSHWPEGALWLGCATMVRKDVPFERNIRAALTRLHDIPYLQTHQRSRRLGEPFRRARRPCPFTHVCMSGWRTWTSRCAVSAQLLGVRSRRKSSNKCVIRAKTYGCFGGSRSRKTGNGVQPKTVENVQRFHLYEITVIRNKRVPVVGAANRLSS
jgi:hypothetical protein